MLAQANPSERTKNDSLLEAHRVMRLVMLGLGVLWILDGLLQLQPQMFTQNLPANVVGFALMSLPAPLYFWSLKMLIRFFMPHPAFWDFCIVVLQLGIGISLIAGSRMVQRAALGISVVWGLAVWVFAEGMGWILSGTMSGGVFPGTPSIMNGFPGAALLYALVALLLLLPDRQWDLSTGRFSLVKKIPVVLFLMFAAVEAAPLMWTTFGQASIFAANTDNVPKQLIGTIVPLVKFAASHPAVTNSLELGACLLAAFGLWRDRWWGYSFALAWLGFVWWFGLGLGGILTAGGTDPNTPPAILLLMLPAIAWKKNSLKKRRKIRVEEKLFAFSLLFLSRLLSFDLLKMSKHPTKREPRIVTIVHSQNLSSRPTTKIEVASYPPWQTSLDHLLEGTVKSNPQQ